MADLYPSHLCLGEQCLIFNCFSASVCKHGLLSLRKVGKGEPFSLASYFIPFR